MEEKVTTLHRIARQLGACAAALLAVLAGSAAFAQANYPNRPIRVLTPFSAGGGSDILARLIGPQITEKWGQPVIVDNRPGGGGTLGASIAARAEARRLHAHHRVRNVWRERRPLQGALRHRNDIPPIISSATTPLVSWCIRRCP